MIQRNLKTLKNNSKINRTEILINEMKKRKKSCLIKLQKLSDRINILEGFKNQTSGKKLNLKDYLKSKGYDYRNFFTPMGYYTPNNMVVSDDIENEALTYHKGMSFNKNIGYHIPEREIVKEKDHQEITSSIYGMTWNPALNHYYPTTVFDSKAYSSAEGIGDTGMDMIGGLRMEDFANLTNEDEFSKELTSMVQGLLEEEYDNVEGELDLIIDSQNQLNGYDSSFEGEEDNRKVQSGKNLACRTGCASKHALNKTKRQACEDNCEEIIRTQGYSDFSSKGERKENRKNKKAERKENRNKRKEARDEFRADKKGCKAKLKSGEIQQWQYKECVKKERKEKRSDIKEAGGNVLTRSLRTFAKITPIVALARGGVLILVGENTWGFATRLAPALLPDAEAKELFKPEAIVSAKKGWDKVAKGYKNMGGDPNKLKNKAIAGYKKKPYKVSKKSSFDGDSLYEFSEIAGVDDAVAITTAVATGISALAGLVSSFTKAGGEKNPYKDDKTPEDYKKGMEDGSVESNPPTEEKAPILNDKGEWIEPSTGKVIDPMTGKYKDTIFGINKWLAIGIGVAGVVGLYYIFKSKK
jgi:hypothetical protein